MFGLLLTLLILDGVLLMVIILLQAGKGGGLAAMGGGGGAGTESFMGGRQAATVLTKSTWAAGAVFLALAVILAIMSSQRTESAPLLQDEFQTTPTAPQPILPGGEEGEAEPGEGVPGVGDAAPEGGEGSDGQ